MKERQDQRKLYLSKQLSSYAKIYRHDRVVLELCNSSINGTTFLQRRTNWTCTDDKL